MEFIKKHRIGLIVTGVILVLVILMFFGIKNAFFSNMGQSVYGNRLDGIEKYPIDDAVIKDIETTLKDTGNISSFKYELKGRLMNFIIEVNADVDLTTSRAFADKIAEKLSDDIRSFYDIQVYLTCSDKESELYPTIGYKHKTSVGFKWNNN